MKHSECAPIYEVVQSEVSIEEAGQCTTYGIACVFKDSTAGKSQAITIADISVDRAFVEDTASFFNRVSLSPHCFRRAVMEITLKHIQMKAFCISACSSNTHMSCRSECPWRPGTAWDTPGLIRF